ncbi:CcmD family protein [Pontibacter sp. H259]|uniref:CcmD family protein n=1 Tax=Pontibacter sp. H259 TaxID=3133421 RepID=UPI0030BC9569
MKLFRILAICSFMLCTLAGIQHAQAQPAQTQVEYSSAPATTEVEMADTLRQDGKIYVVVIVLLTILAGLIIYLIMLDRKVSKLEKQFKE